MFMSFEPNINVDEELSALLADFDAFAGVDVANGLVADGGVEAPFVDPAPVLNPMIGDDGAVFGDPAAPALVDGDPPAAVVDIVASVFELDDAATVSFIADFDIDALPQGGDLGGDFDALILSVGRSLESFSFDLVA